MVHGWFSGRILACHVGGLGLFPGPCGHRLPFLASLVAQMVKCLPAMWETWVWSLGREDALEKEMANHSSSLAWKIPGTEELGRLQSMGSQRVGHNWVISLSLSFSIQEFRPRLSLTLVSPNKAYKTKSESVWLLPYNYSRTKLENFSKNKKKSSTQ